MISAGFIILTAVSLCPVSLSSIDNYEKKWKVQIFYDCVTKGVRVVPEL